MSDSSTPSLPELLGSQPASNKRRRRRRSHRNRLVKFFQRFSTKYDWRISLLMGVGVTAAIILMALILSLNARDRVDNSWRSLDRIWQTISSKPGTELTLSDFERLHAAVQDLNSSLSGAKTQTAFLRPFKFANGDLATGLEVLDASQQLVMASDEMLSGMQPVMFFLTQGGEDETVTTQISSGERVVELLDLGRGRFLSAQQRLDNAKQQIDDLDLNKVSSDMLVTLDDLSAYYRQLNDINNMMLESPDLLIGALGLEETQTYLVLSQNNDELRPSGGYISTYGWITVRNGRIEDYNYNPTTATSPNPPPDALAGEVVIPDWWIQYQNPIYAAWDSSWSPDFPTTAQMAAWYYDNGGNPQSPVDGVIAIDIAGFEYILKGLGSVTVEGYDEVVSPATFREVVYKIRAEGEGDRPHKAFLSALYRQILKDWQSVDPEKNLDIRGGLLSALQEKHIMIYFTDTDLNQAIDVLGWSGLQKDGADNDYLMVVDANLGNKANHSVLRQLTYDTEILADGSLNSQVAISYDYSARVAENDPAVHPEHGPLNYRSLLQVFVPVNSTLTESNNLRFAPTVVGTTTHTSFVSQIGIDYNQNERFSFAYTTPQIVEEVGPYRRYKLILQKQPGTLNESVNVQITLPEGAAIIHTSPSPVASYQ
ncbi:MAG: DUF4012 domain-containing protein, partial [Chloroflexi bacterium]|nr:DUF4012 domain-containing protein [Chloroflexota bacterium]